MSRDFVKGVGNRLIPAVTQDQALAMRADYRAGMGYVTLKAKYKVAQSVVKDVINGRHMTIRGATNIARPRGTPTWRGLSAS